MQSSESSCNNNMNVAWCSTPTEWNWSFCHFEKQAASEKVGKDKHITCRRHRKLHTSIKLWHMQTLWMACKKVWVLGPWVQFATRYATHNKALLTSNQILITELNLYCNILNITASCQYTHTHTQSSSTITSPSYSLIFALSAHVCTHYKISVHSNNGL
jgi:hypothetical protein